MTGTFTRYRCRYRHRRGGGRLHKRIQNGLQIEGRRGLWPGVPQRSRFAVPTPRCGSSVSGPAPPQINVGFNRDHCLVSEGRADSTCFSVNDCRLVRPTKMTPITSSFRKRGHAPLPRGRGRSPPLTAPSVLWIGPNVSRAWTPLGIQARLPARDAPSIHRTRREARSTPSVAARAPRPRDHSQRPNPKSCRHAGKARRDLAPTAAWQIAPASRAPTANLKRND